MGEFGLFRALYKTGIRGLDSGVGKYLFKDMIKEANGEGAIKNSIIMASRVRKTAAFKSLSKSMTWGAGAGVIYGGYSGYKNGGVGGALKGGLEGGAVGAVGGFGFNRSGLQRRMAESYASRVGKRASKEVIEKSATKAGRAAAKDTGLSEMRNRVGMAYAMGGTGMGSSYQKAEARAAESMATKNTSSYGIHNANRRSMFDIVPGVNAEQERLLNLNKEPPFDPSEYTKIVPDFAKEQQERNAFFSSKSRSPLANQEKTRRSLARKADRDARIAREEAVRRAQNSMSLSEGMSKMQHLSTPIHAPNGINKITGKPNPYGNDLTLRMARGFSSA